MRTLLSAFCTFSHIVKLDPIKMQAVLEEAMPWQSKILCQFRACRELILCQACTAQAMLAQRALVKVSNAI